MTRRNWIAGVIGAASVRAANEDAIGRAHDEFWSRFIDSKYSTVYDYAPLRGSVIIPTPEECRECKPNGMSWWTPIENGAFFGGLYLGAMCNRWKEVRSSARAKDAHTVAEGLIRLAKIGSTPGFIGRGISTDGTSHYPASSSDQTYPWFYGMYCYLSSGLVSGARLRTLTALVEEKALALEKNLWRMPSDRPNFGYFGEWLAAFSEKRTTLTGAEPQFDAAARLLFIHLAMYRLTRKKRWHELYLQLRDERPEGTRNSRLDICSRGVEYAPPGTPAKYPEHPPVWTSASSQAGLRILSELDDAPRIQARYREGLKANAQRASAYLPLHRQFDNGDSSTFRHDWRFLNDSWVRQESIPEAVTLATRQVREWHKQSPRKVYECEKVRDPLFSAWIVALAGDQSALPAMLDHYRWDRMHTGHFFAAECARYASSSAG